MEASGVSNGLNGKIVFQIGNLLADSNKFMVIDQRVFQQFTLSADTIGNNFVLIHLCNQHQCVQCVEQKMWIDLVLKHL